MSSQMTELYSSATEAGQHTIYCVNLLSAHNGQESWPSPQLPPEQGRNRGPIPARPRKRCKRAVTSSQAWEIAVAIQVFGYLLPEPLERPGRGRRSWLVLSGL